MARLFVAVDLPEAATKELAVLCRDLPAARWTNLAQLHLTLRFLGDTPDDRIADLRARLRAVRAARFSLAGRAVGVFPPKRRPAHVLWAGVTPLEPVRALKGAIDGVLGVDPETKERGFSPHLTLARFRGDPGEALSAYLARHAHFETAPWTVDAFHLYRSTLGAEAALHEILESYALGGS